ncbi:MAG: hypothetical protein K2I06_07175 [Ruminococcus sp.]|nr:hypothetical protein [Ruminococcus sp.]
MKKLFAVLMACAMMTGVFASCGSEEKEESSESKKDVSVSESSEEDKTTEPETEEDTTESETTTETTTEEATETTTKKEKEEKTTESDEEDTSDEETEDTNAEGVSYESIAGAWLMTMGFNFKEDGNADIFMDMTELTHFTSDGKLFMDDEIFESDCISYDGNVLAVTVNEQDAFTMTKESGSEDSFDGLYTMTSGVIYDSLMNSVDESTEVFVIVIGEKLYSGYKNMFTYSENNGTVHMTGLETIGIDEDIESQYEINGDILTLHDFDGEEWEMKRVDIFD